MPVNITHSSAFVVILAVGPDRFAGDAREAAAEHAVAVLRKDISDFEHQAAKKDGGCGCV